MLKICFIYKAFLKKMLCILGETFFQVKYIILNENLTLSCLLKYCDLWN